MVKFTDEGGKKIEFELSAVDKVYSGKPNTCMCGCAGKYFKNDSKMGPRVCRHFEHFIGRIQNLHGNIFTIVSSPTRQYTIYLKK